MELPRKGPQIVLHFGHTVDTNLTCGDRKSKKRVAKSDDEESDVKPRLKIVIPGPERTFDAKPLYQYVEVLLKMKLILV